MLNVDELLEDMSPPPEDPGPDRNVAHGIPSSIDQSAVFLVQEAEICAASSEKIEIPESVDKTLEAAIIKADEDMTEADKTVTPQEESQPFEPESVSAPLSRPLLLALRAASLNLPPSTLEKAVLAANRSAMQMAADELLRLLPDALSSKVKKTCMSVL